MRPYYVLLHRWVGLLMAGFLFLTGLTGAVISWDHELDDWLNPHLTEARATGRSLPVLELVRQVEARYPQIRVTSVPLQVVPGESLSFFAQARVNPATGKLFEPGFNQVFVDPASGAELGKRNRGAVWPITRETLVSFLYKLHYSLHLPEMGGTDVVGHRGVHLVEEAPGLAKIAAGAPPAKPPHITRGPNHPLGLPILPSQPGSFSLPSQPGIRMVS